MPAIIAGVVVLVVVVVAVVVLGGKKTKPTALPPPPPPVVQPAPVVVKKGPELGPRPNLPADIVARAKAMMPRIEAASTEGKRLGDEAVKAKKDGDQDAWRTDEARGVQERARRVDLDRGRAGHVPRAQPQRGWDEKC
jgi:hypothetical protein